MTTRAKKTSMATENVTIAPGEELIKQMDFANKLQSGVTIDSVDSVTIDPAFDAGAGHDLQSIGSPVASGTKVQTKLKATTPDRRYTVTILASTSDDQIVKGEGRIRVDE